MFETTVDLVALISTDFVRQQIIASLESSEDMSTEGSPSADEIVEALIASLTESEIVSYEYIDLESGYYVSEEGYVSLTIDTAPIIALDEASAETEDVPAIITVEVATVFERSEIDEVEAIEAPADGVVVPFADLVNMGISTEGSAQ